MKRHDERAGSVEMAARVPPANVDVRKAVGCSSCHAFLEINSLSVGRESSLRWCRSPSTVCLNYMFSEKRAQ
jgi:hypothetical protein